MLATIVEEGLKLSDEDKRNDFYYQVGKLKQFTDCAKDLPSKFQFGQLIKWIKNAEPRNFDLSDEGLISEELEKLVDGHAQAVQNCHEILPVICGKHHPLGR